MKWGILSGLFHPSSFLFVLLRDAELEKLFVFLRFPHQRHPAARKRWSRSRCRSPILSFLLMFSRNGMSSRLAMTSKLGVTAKEMM